MSVVGGVSAHWQRKVAGVGREAWVCSSDGKGAGLLVKCPSWFSSDSLFGVCVPNAWRWPREASCVARAFSFSPYLHSYRHTAPLFN